MDTFGSTDAPGSDAAGSVAVPDGASSSSYPGGKSGAGVYQRLINMIPPHQVLISAFAGQCGVVRNIRPAEHTIVIDADADVCQWWDSWRRSPEGRNLEVHHCDSIEWLRYRFSLTEYFAAGARDVRSHVATRCDAAATPKRAAAAVAANSGDTRATLNTDAAAGVASELDGRPTPSTPSEAFIFCDPPYVLSERSHGKQYSCELSDDGHRRLIRILSQISAARTSIMLCGYTSAIYANLSWRSIDHRVPTRGGLQDERIWLNYAEPEQLHDYQHIGNCRRSRERIRRRQRNWQSQLNAMPPRERAAMLAFLNNQPDSVSG